MGKIAKLSWTLFVVATAATALVTSLTGCGSTSPSSAPPSVVAGSSAPIVIRGESLVFKVEVEAGAVTGLNWTVDGGSNNVDSPPNPYVHTIENPGNFQFVSLTAVGGADKINKFKCTILRGERVVQGPNTGTGPYGTCTVFYQR